MSVGDLWFGNTELFSAIVAPPQITADRVGYYESMGFENGGAASARSNAGAADIRLTYPWLEVTDAGSATLFSEYRAGEYGEGDFYLANPSAYDLNVLEPRWASPRLVELDHPNIYATDPSWGATAANSYKQPARKGTWSVTTAANATPLTDTTIPFTIIPIPPEYTLHIGCTGAATGTAVVRVESWVNGAAAAGATADLTLLSETGSTRMNATVLGATYAYAKVFITRTSSAASTITPISMMAQLHLAAASPTLTGLHVRGRGWGGLDFSDEVVPVTMTDVSSGRHYESLTVRFSEVGPWATA